MNYNKMSYKELEIYMKEQQHLKDKLMKEAYKAPDIYEFERLSEKACYPIWIANLYYKVKKPLSEIEMENQKVDDVLFTLDDFVECCKDGGFIDYDGFGNYATETEVSDLVIKPSDITEGIFRKDFTHIVWYNR